MMPRTRALSLFVVTLGAVFVLGEAIGAWDPELSFPALFLLVAVMLLALCASIWFACAIRFRFGIAARIAAASVLPLLVFWILLRIDGALLNDAVFALLFFPLLVLEGGVLVFLERRRPSEPQPYPPPASHP